MTVDTSAPLFTATAEHLIGTASQARADLAAAVRERDEARAEARIERRWRQALEVEVARVMHENRELRKANLTWQERAAAQAPTVEIPRIPAEPEPVRRRTGSRARKGKRR